MSQEPVAAGRTAGPREQEIREVYKLAEREMQGRMELFVPLSQAAEMLGCSSRQVSQLIDQGKLEIIKLQPNRIRVSRTSLLQYLSLVHRAVNRSA